MRSTPTTAAVEPDAQARAQAAGAAVTTPIVVNVTRSKRLQRFVADTITPGSWDYRPFPAVDRRPFRAPIGAGRHPPRHPVEPRDELSAATLYPLFAGLATRQQAARVAAVVKARLLVPGGIVTTTIDMGRQWDAPNGWAPLQWIAVRRLAGDIACRWVATVRRVYANTGMMFEKYNVERERPGGGEYPVQDGFGWTSGVTRGLLRRYPDLRSAAPASRYNRGAACAPVTRLPRRPPPSATGACSSPCGASSRAGASCRRARCPSSSASMGRSPAA